MTTTKSTSGQADANTISEVYALFAQLAYQLPGYERLVVFRDGSGHISTLSDDRQRPISFISLEDAAKELRAEIAKVAPPDTRIYLQRWDAHRGKWVNIKNTIGDPIRWAMPKLAHKNLAWVAERNPGVGYRLADSNSNPLSLPFCVSDSVTAESLRHVRPMNIDRVYESEEV